MADILIKVDETVMPDIAKAIMSKTGKTDPLKITQFAEEINRISGSGGSSGTYNTDLCGYEYFYEIGCVSNVVEALETVVEESPDEVKHMYNWKTNDSAASAYKCITYSPIDNSNKCTYFGVGGHEVIYFTKNLEKGKTYTLSLDYYSPNNIIGEYEEPYAPFIGFFPYNPMSTNGNPYSVSYAKTVFPTGAMSGYKSYQCTYTPTSNITGYIGFVTGCTLDGMEVDFYLKNIEFKEEVV